MFHSQKSHAIRTGKKPKTDAKSKSKAFFDKVVSPVKEPTPIKMPPDPQVQQRGSK